MHTVYSAKKENAFMTELEIEKPNWFETMPLSNIPIFHDWGAVKF